VSSFSCLLGNLILCIFDHLRIFWISLIIFVFFSVIYLPGSHFW
jgi:hypothetical protein